MHEPVECELKRELHPSDLACSSFCIPFIFGIETSLEIISVRWHAHTHGLVMRWALWKKRLAPPPFPFPFGFRRVVLVSFGEVLMSPSEFEWVLLKSQCIQVSSVWVQVGSSKFNLFKWVQVNPRESKWIQVNPSVSKWIQLTPIESIWIRVNPGGMCILVLVASYKPVLHLA